MSSDHRTVHVVTCYDCRFEQTFEDGDAAIKQRDSHAEENGHEVYKEKERVKRDE